jgi:hypothetical protein
MKRKCETFNELPPWSNQSPSGEVDSYITVEFKIRTFHADKQSPEYVEPLPATPANSDVEAARKVTLRGNLEIARQRVGNIFGRQLWDSKLSQIAAT